MSLGELLNWQMFIIIMWKNERLNVSFHNLESVVQLVRGGSDLWFQPQGGSVSYSVDVFWHLLTTGTAGFSKVFFNFLIFKPRT